MGRHASIALAVVLAVAVRAAAADAEVQALVRQLGAEDCAAREEAERKLVALGERAEEALRAAEKSDDAEVHLRAAHALQEVQRRREARALADALRRFAKDSPDLVVSFARTGLTLEMKTSVERRGDKDVLVCEDTLKTGGGSATTRDVLDLATMTSVELVSDHREARIRDGKVVFLDNGGAVAKEAPLAARSGWVFAGFTVVRLAACVAPEAGKEWPFTFVSRGMWEDEIAVDQTLHCTGEEAASSDPGSPRGWAYRVKGGIIPTLSLHVGAGGRLLRVSVEDETVEPVRR